MFAKLFTLALFLAFVSLNECIEIACNQRSVDQLDENVQKLVVFGDPNRRFPNEKEVQSHCQADYQMIAWGKNYTKTCLVTRKVETSRHVTNLLLFSVKKVLNKRCRSEATRKVFINAGKCGNYAKSETMKCYNQYTLDTEQINKAKHTVIKNDKHLIPLLCCSYHKFHDCSVDAWAKTNGAEPCDRKATLELDSYVNDSMYDVLQYLCGDYQENNDKCDHLLNNYKHVFNSVKVKNIPKSSLSGSNDVFNSIPPL